MQQRNSRDLRNVSKRPWWWLCVFLAGFLALTTWAVVVSWRNVDLQAQAQFEQKFERLETSVRAQFRPIGNAIHGLMGLYAANHRLQATEFREWVASHDLSQEYPGLRQFGLIERQYTPVNHPPREGRESAALDSMVVRFAQPALPGKSVTGLQVAPGSAVRESIEQAIDFGDPVLTRTHAAGGGEVWNAEFLYLMAFYTSGPEPQTEEDRRSRLAGVLFASLSLDELLLEATSTTEGLVDFEVFDGIDTTTQTLVFSTLRPLGAKLESLEPTDFSARQFRMERRLWVDGRVLLLRAASSPMLEASVDHTRPKLIALICSLLSLMFAWAVASLIKSREKAVDLNHQMSLDIARLARVVQTTHHVVVTADAQLHITWANDAYSHISGQSLHEVLGQPLSTLIAQDVSTTELRDRALQTLLSHEALRVQVAWRTPAKAIRWYNLDFQPERDVDGNFNGYTAIGADMTEQHAAHAELQEALRENEQLMEALDHHSIVSISDSSGRITYANEMFMQISGYSREELIGANHRVVKSSEQPEGFWADVWKTISSGYSWRGTVGNRAKNGAVYWVDTAITPFFDERGNIVKYVSIRSDVTAARRAQADLRQNNLVMQSILENIPVALSVFDAQLNLVARNQKFLELLQFPPHLFEGPVTSFESLIRFNAARGEYGTDNTEQIVQDIVERARHTTVHQFERVRPGGLALEVRGAPMPGGGFITTYADISARKQAEAEIERARNMLQSVLDSASEVAVITMDLNHRITLFNRGAERLLGYSAEQATQELTPEVFFDAAELEARSSALSVQLGRPVLGLDVLLDATVLGKRSDWTYVRQDGQRISVVIVITELTDASGQRVGYLSVSHDITQEKAHEARLQIAMEEAEQAALAKGQFLANMSHEIRTPMNAILGMLKLLQNTTLDHRQQDYTGKAESAAKALLGLLNDILDFSKSEAGKMQLDPQPFRLDQLLRDLSVILSANVGSRGIEVLFDVDARLPDMLVGDSLRLQQILINLSGNAIKFTEQGEVIVSLAQVRRDAETVTLRIAVQDSGIGIDPKNQQHIFAGFSQAEASTTRRFGGTGLGLSISKRLVALMGSEMQLDSTLGKGSTFHFTLTLPIAAAPHAPQSPNAADASADSAQGLRVLLVDNNPVARKILSSMCQSLGWTVETAGSGPEALQRLAYRAEQKQDPFQAVFLDWQMTPLDGWETASRMHQSPSSIAGPLIGMVTAHGREMLEHKAQAQPQVLNGFVIKPSTASMLQQAMADAQAHLRNPHRTAIARPAKATPLAGMRLLVVEDNLINQQVARELLSAEGAMVDLAGNGQLGVDAVAQAHPPYDAVLMDIQMPVMDGYTAAVTIRHELGMVDLPIIAMTANAMASDREACLASGMNDHIGKPFDVPALVALLRQHTKRSEFPAASTAPIPAPHSEERGGENAALRQNSNATDVGATTLIDPEAARTLLGNNDTLYVQITEAYLSEIANLPQRIEELLERQELMEANRVLHTIKGLSLTVGAMRLSAACKAAESQLKTCIATPSPLDADWTARLCTQLRDLVVLTTQALREAIAPLQTLAAPTPADLVDTPVLHTSQLVQDLQQLEKLLLHSDLSALDLHAALRSRHASGAGRRLDALEQSVKALDFAQGVVQCQSLIREFSSTP